MPTEFEIAFANARKQGLKTFNYGGNLYTTKYKEEKMLDDAIADYPAMQKIYNNENTRVSLANEERMKLYNKNKLQGKIETFFPEDTDNPDFPHPAPGKFAFEIYHKDYWDDPKINKAAIFLDAIHGMVKDPKWKAMRDEFNQNWTAKELEFIKKKHATEANKGESLAAFVDRTVLDGYLRGGLNPLDDATLSTNKYSDEPAMLFRKWKRNDGKEYDDIYSETQRALIAKMQAYLKTK